MAAEAEIEKGAVRHPYRGPVFRLDILVAFLAEDNVLGVVYAGVAW